MIDRLEVEHVLQVDRQQDDRAEERRHHHHHERDGDGEVASSGTCAGRAAPGRVRCRRELAQDERGDADQRRLASAIHIGAEPAAVPLTSPPTRLRP